MKAATVHNTAGSLDGILGVLPAGEMALILSATCQALCSVTGIGRPCGLASIELEAGFLPTQAESHFLPSVFASLPPGLSSLTDL